MTTFQFFNSTAGRLFMALPALTAVALSQLGCTANSDPAPPPPPEVAVLKVATAPVTLFEEYPGQTEAPDTIEIRARVGGWLEHQDFVDGAQVHKGQVLFVLDQRPFTIALAQAEASLAQAEASLVNSRQNLGRLERLVEDHAVSQQDLDAAVAKERADSANVEALRAAERQARLNLDYATIRAPREGVISKALVKPGALVVAAQTLLSTLYSSDPIYVNFTVSESKLLDLTRSLKISGNGKSEYAQAFQLKLVDGREYKFPGRLNFIDAAVDQKTGTLQVRLAVRNPDYFLRPGQFVRVSVPTANNPNAIRIPERAVQELQGVRSVFVVDAEGKAAYRQITANARMNNDWVVEAGLMPGETIIVDGAQKVRPGAPVRAVPYEASKQSAAGAAAHAAPPKN